MEYPKGMQLFACPYHLDYVEDAKDYIYSNGYDANSVKLLHVDGQLIVVKL